MGWLWLVRVQEEHQKYILYKYHVSDANCSLCEDPVLVFFLITLRTLFFYLLDEVVNWVFLDPKNGQISLLTFLTYNLKLPAATVFLPGHPWCYYLCQKLLSPSPENPILNGFCSGVVEEYVACDPLHVSCQKHVHTYIYWHLLSLCQPDSCSGCKTKMLIYALVTEVYPADLWG